VGVSEVGEGVGAPEVGRSDVGAGVVGCGELAPFVVGWSVVGIALVGEIVGMSLVGETVGALVGEVLGTPPGKELMHVPVGQSWPEQNDLKQTAAPVLQNQDSEHVPCSAPRPSQTSSFAISLKCENWQQILTEEVSDSRAQLCFSQSGEPPHLSKLASQYFASEQTPPSAWPSSQT